MWAILWGRKEIEEDWKQECEKPSVMIRKWQPEHMVGEEREGLCESLHIPVPDYVFPVTHEQKDFGHRIDLIIRMAVHRAMVKVLPVVGNVSLQA